MHHQWMKRENAACPYMEYYSAIKRNEVLVQVKTWMNLENMMLSERSQLQKDHILSDSICMKCPEQVSP